MVNELKKRLPPYISYRTFQHFIEMLQQDGVPARIDRSFWGEKYSGSVGTQLISALRYLELIDNENVPTLNLKELVQRRGGQRIDVLKHITTNSYVFIMGKDFDGQKATHQQMQELFHKNFDLKDDVARKCIKFFVSLATEADVKVSPFILKNFRNSQNSTIVKKPSRKNAERTKIIDAEPVALAEIPRASPSGELMGNLLKKFPELDPSWPEAVKLKWFDAFFEMLKRNFDGLNGNGSIGGNGIKG
jgi:hypothetical protein